MDLSHSNVSRLAGDLSRKAISDISAKSTVVVLADVLGHRTHI